MRWAALFLLSCAGAAPAPTLRSPAPENVRSAGVDALDGNLRIGPPHPRTRKVSFDLQTVPIATWGAPDPKMRFTISTISALDRAIAFDVAIRGAEIAELDLPAWNGAELFTAYTGQFFRGKPPICNMHGSRPACWAGIFRRTWTDDALEVELGRGELGLETCTTTSRESVRAHAAAIVKGLVYAVRVREVHDAFESLWIFLPRGTLVAAGDDPYASLATSNTGAFTRLTLPLVDRRSSSAVVRVSAPALALWSRLRQGQSPTDFEDRTAASECLLVEIDVTRQGDITTASVSFAPPDNPKFERTLSTIATD